MDFAAPPHPGTGLQPLDLISARRGKARPTSRSSSVTSWRSACTFSVSSLLRTTNRASEETQRCATSPLKACFTAPHYPLSERARASTAAGLTSRSGSAPRPLPQFRWNTVSPGDKICLPGRQIRICLRGRQNLSPWETKFVSLGDNALYSKNPFRFHKESCCYAARAREPRT
jgi:hypothetical protein